MYDDVEVYWFDPVYRPDISIIFTLSLIMADLYSIPTVIDAPAGYIVDFNNPQRRAVHVAYLLAGIGGFLSLLFVIQRLYTKVVLMRCFQLDDGMFYRSAPTHV